MTSYCMAIAHACRVRALCVLLLVVCVCVCCLCGVHCVRLCLCAWSYLGMVQHAIPSVTARRRSTRNHMEGEEGDKITTCEEKEDTLQETGACHIVHDM